jgi:hypothetical protein
MRRLFITASFVSWAVFISGCGDGADCTVETRDGLTYLVCGSSEAVLSGESGQDGQAGEAGQDGAAGPAGAVGPDGEAGPDGQDAYDILTDISDVVANPTADDGVDGCVNGGHLVQMGRDDGFDDADETAGTANDGILDAGEVESSIYLCNGADGSARLSNSGTVDPGDYLALAIPAGMTDLSFDAQVIHDGRVIDYGDYGQNADPILARRTLSNQIMGNGSYGRLGAARLANGNYVVIWTIHWTSGTHASYLSIVDPDGVVLIGPVQLTHFDGSLGQSSLISLRDGGFVFFANGRPNGIMTDSYRFIRGDNDGIILESGNLISDSKNVRSPGVLVSSGSGFALFYGDADDSGLENQAFLEIYDASADLIGTTITLTDMTLWYGTFLVEEQADGSFAILYVGTVDVATHAIIMQTDGQILSDVTLEHSGGYGDRASVTISDTGNWLAIFNSYDASVYTVLNDTGAIVRGPISYVDREPEGVTATVLPDGNFAFSYSDEGEDASGVRVLQIVDNDGDRFTGPVTGISNDTRVANLFGQDNNRIVSFFYQSSYRAELGIEYIALARGNLELHLENPEEARLYNYTAQTLDVMMSAY